MLFNESFEERFLLSCGLVDIDIDSSLRIRSISKAPEEETELSRIPAIVDRARYNNAGPIPQKEARRVRGHENRESKVSELRIEHLDGVERHLSKVFYSLFLLLWFSDVLEEKIVPFVAGEIRRLPLLKHLAQTGIGDGKSSPFSACSPRELRMLYTVPATEKRRYQDNACFYSSHPR